jgi:hypothetical protein
MKKDFSRWGQKHIALNINQCIFLDLDKEWYHLQAKLFA